MQPSCIRKSMLAMIDKWLKALEYRDDAYSAEIRNKLYKSKQLWENVPNDFNV